MVVISTQGDEDTGTVDVRFVVQRWRRVAELVGFNSDPDEAADLGDHPEGECYPSTSASRPALHVEELAVGDD